MREYVPRKYSLLAKRSFQNAVLYTNYSCCLKMSPKEKRKERAGGNKQSCFLFLRLFCSHLWNGLGTVGEQFPTILAVYREAFFQDQSFPLDLLLFILPHL